MSEEQAEMMAAWLKDLSSPLASFEVIEERAGGLHYTIECSFDGVMYYTIEYASSTEG